MQTLPRGESRRTAHTPEPARRRRTPSSSSIPLPSRLSHLTSYLQSVTYLVAAAPSLPLILLALPTTLFSAVFLLPFRPSWHSIRITFSTPHLPVLTALHVSHILAALVAIRLIGPVRALLSLGAHPTIVHIFAAHPQRPTSRSFARLILTFIALSLLAYDVSVDVPAVRVRDRVLQTSAARAVHERIQHISHRINFQSLPFRHRNQSQSPPEVRLSDPLQQPKPPADPPPPPKTPPDKNVSNATGARRRLMALVDGGDSDHAHTANKPKNQSISAGRPRDSQPSSNKSSKETSVKQPPLHVDMQQSVSSQHTDTVKSSPQESVSRLVAALGVVLACSASVAGRAAAEMRDRVMADAGDWAAISVALFMSTSLVFSVMLVGTSIAAMVQGQAIFAELFSNALPRGIILSLSWLAVPVLLQVHGRGLLRPVRAQRVPKGPSPVAAIALSSSILDIDSSAPTVLSFYFTIMSTLFVFRVAHAPITSETVGALTYTAGALLLISAKVASSSGPRISRRVMTGSSGDLSVHLTKGATSRLRSLWLAFRSSVSASLKGVKDLVVHARSNKASWQVLNFLILQSTTAVVELIYATITNSSGLFSISADNFFCSVALAIGLIAIRMSSRKPGLRFSYGFGRVESLCGFANGIILVYVGILVILEAFERSNEDAAIAIGRAFSVCLLGLVGNMLGLYFFPMESKRENHNVQGIYLHIWANTFSFARIALSTGIITIVPKWKWIDMVSAGIVGLGMIIGAIPLVFRSGRVLLLMPSLKKERSISPTKRRLEGIPGVKEVCSLRVWNLTPNYLVGSVRLKVSRRYEDSDAEILLRAREILGDIHVPRSQCTIQITRVEDNSESVVYLHKRSRSSVPDTGINVDMLGSTTKSNTDCG